MIIYNVAVTGRLPQISKELIMSRFMDDLAEWTKNTAKAIAPVRTGRLRDSIDITKSVNGEQYIRDVTAQVIYAEVVEVGRKKFAPFFGRYYMRATALLIPEFINNYVERYIREGVLEAVV